MKRVAFYLFYDEQGIVDDYVIYKLNALREFVEHIFVVSNSQLTPESRKKLEAVSDTIFCRENIGFDVWGYKEAMEKFGTDRLKDYDEAIFLNYTFFGPIFPFSEAFAAAEAENVDFWGLSDHAAVKGVLPQHIQSHFIAVRNKLLNSIEFSDYWEKMPNIESYDASVLHHESKFTNHFSKKGFTCYVYCSEKNYPSEYPTFFDVHATLEDRCPLIKRRIFFNDPLFTDVNAVMPFKALEFIEKNTEYPVDLIRQNLLRTVPPKTLANSLELLKVFDASAGAASPINSPSRIAVIAHVYYPDMLGEIMDYINNIDQCFDLFITTASEESKKNIECHLAMSTGRCKKIEVRIVEENRGRDISALLITCKDINEVGRYDAICRVHSKKSPQVCYNSGQLFKSHMYENVLSSSGYINQILNFLSKPYIGFLMPTMIHVGYSTLGHSWFVNKEETIKWAKKLGIKTKFDEISPHAAYGTMFWYRPIALKKLFDYEWKWSDFNAEVADDKSSKGHTDGSTAHAIERLFTYCCHDAGYLAYCIATTDSIKTDYVKLEYKMNRVMSQFSDGDVLYHVNYLQAVGGDSIHKLLAQVIRILKKRVGNRSRLLTIILKPPYLLAKRTYRAIFIR